VAWLVQTHGGRPGYEWAQYASGIVGGAAIAVWCARWWRSHPPTGPADPPVSRGLRASAWTALALSTVVGAGLGVRSGLTGATGQVPGLFFLAATKGGGTGAAVAVVLSLAWTLWSARLASRPAGART
jgi:Domain of unknown function (DUF4184)